MPTGHRAVGRYTKKLQLSSNDFFSGCGFVKRKRKLLSISFVNVHILQSADLGYLALHSLLA